MIALGGKGHNLPLPLPGGDGKGQGENHRVTEDTEKDVGANGVRRAIAEVLFALSRHNCLLPSSPLLPFAFCLLPLAFFPLLPTAYCLLPNNYSYKASPPLPGLTRFAHGEPDPANFGTIALPG